MKQPPGESICERFNQYAWHDSKFLSMRFLHGGEQNTGDLILDVLLRQQRGGQPEFQSAQLIFKDCTILRIHLDVEAKAACAHDIAGAICSTRSEFMEELERSQMKYESDPLAGFVHFHLMLCPPSGDVHAIARGFEMNLGAP